MKPRPTIIVLAAGEGRRFAGERHKLEQPLAAGSVLATTLRHAMETALPIIVVTTAALAPIVTAQLARRDILVLADEQARRGMGHSIAAGVSERASASGWLVLPGDMPLVRPQTLLTVAAALEHHAVAYAQHRGRRGHPVAFAPELFSELIALQGDEGARRLLARYPAYACEVDDPGVLVDVDTVADLAAVRATGT
jgi:molybdenum cofactor cytidylyltransferase